MLNINYYLAYMLLFVMPVMGLWGYAAAELHVHQVLFFVITLLMASVMSLGPFLLFKE